MLRTRPPLLLTTRWIATAGLSVDQLTAWGILYYAYTVLSAPVAADLGLSRTFVAGAFSVCLVTSGWLAPLVGRWSDRFGARELLVGGALLGALSMLALAAAAGPVVLGLAFVSLGAAQALSLYEPAFRAIVDWFPEPAPRARALLALTCVGGLASTVFLPATALSVERFGWRPTVVGFAVLLALVLAPARWLLPRRLPPPSGSTPEKQTSGVVGVRSATWLGRAFAIQAFASTGVSIYLVWHQVEHGHTMAAAAVVAGLAGAAQVPGRVLVTMLQHWVSADRRFPLLIALQALALGVVVSSTGVVAMGGVLVFGAIGGMMTLERATIVVLWYGPAGFGARNGTIVAITRTAKAASPVVIAAIHAWASYDTIFAGLGAWLLLGAGCAARAGTARREETRDVSPPTSHPSD